MNFSGTVMIDDRMHLEIVREHDSIVAHLFTEEMRNDVGGKRRGKPLVQRSVQHMGGHEGCDACGGRVAKRGELDRFQPFT